jgi:hypothetical protein
VRVGMPVDGPPRCTLKTTDRHFGEIGEAEEFLHQRDAGAGGRRERPRAVPGGADHHADRGQFVLGLDDGVARHAVVGVGAVLAAITAEGFDHRRRGRDRIPGRHRGAAIHGTEAAGIVAVDEDLVADAVGTLDAQADRARQVGPGVVVAELEGIDVGADQLVLAAVLVGDQLFDDVEIDAEQGRQRADIHDVLEQLALPRIAVFAVADLGQRNAQHRDVFAKARAAVVPWSSRRTGSRPVRSRRRRGPRSAGSSPP